MPDNFRHAQYDSGGVQIDDPQVLARLNTSQALASQANGAIDGSRTLASVGDSFFANGFFLGPNDNNWYLNNPISWALGLSNHPLTLISQNAVGGSGITAAFSGSSFEAQLTAAIASDAAEIMFMGGVNDVINTILVDSPAASASCLALMQSAYTAHIQRAMAAGRRVRIWTQPTMSSTYGGYSVARNAALFELNKWLVERVGTSGNPGKLRVVDTAAAARDPASTTGNWKANCLLPDGLHPNNVGCYWIGKAGGLGWDDLPSNDRFITSAADTWDFQSTIRQINPNPLMAGATDATGYTQAAIAGGSCVRTLEARADGYGNNQVLTITTSAAGDGWSFKGADVDARAVAGDIIQAEAEIIVPASSNCRAPWFNILQNGAGGFIRYGVCTPATTVANDLALPEGFTFYARTPPMVLSAGQTVLQPEFRPVFAGAVTSTPLKIARMSVRKLYVPY